MPMILKLMHYLGLDALDAPDPLRHHGKLIGHFVRPSDAAAAMQSVSDKEGFRDWPDGFRLLEFPLDHDFFREGFVAGPTEDEALAGDSSGDVGNDLEVEEWGGVEQSDGEINGDPDQAKDPLSNAIWELSHFKIAARSDESYAELGMKVVGIYSTAAAAKAAIARLRGKPGFAQWPGGWRIFPAGINQVGWREGFASTDEDA